MLVTIQGADFFPNCVAYFDGVAATDTTRKSATELTCTPPAHVPGMVDVTVQNPGGASFTLPGGYTYEGDIVSCDFTALPLGACASLPGGMTCSRASDTTVQTGTSSIIMTVGGNNVAAIGQRTDNQSDRGLVIEPARTNVAYPSTPPTTAQGVWAFTPGSAALSGGQADPAFGTNAVRAQIADGQYTWQLLAGTNPTLSTWSFWAQNRNGAGGLTIYQGDGDSHGWQVGAANYTAAWQRISKYLAPADNLFFSNQALATPYYAPVDMNLFGAQCETGKFPTSLIVTTTGAASRAGSQHAFASIASQCTAGRFAPDMEFSVMANITDNDSVGRVWTVDANNFASVDPATQKLTVSVGGLAYTWSMPLTWKQNDKVKLYMSVGNGAPRLAYRVERVGVIVDLGMGNVTHGNMPTSGALTLLSNGTSNQLACTLHKYRGKTPGQLPAWMLAQQATHFRQLSCIGDSLTFGYGLANPLTQSWVGQANVLVGPSFGQPTNLGVTGDTMANINGASRRAQAAATFDAYATHVLVVWAGTNDLAATANGPAATLASLWAFCDYMRSLGWKIVVVTCLPRASITQPQNTFDADRATYNASIRSQWTSHADALSDPASDSRIGPDGSQNNPTYYQADVTHLNATGAGIVASYNAPAILTAAAA